MTKTEIAWLAGIVDGEGCITCTRQRPGTGGRKNWSYRLYLKITMGHKPTIDHIHALVGEGAVTVQPSKKHNTAWTWWIATNGACRVLHLLLPYLVTKRDEALIALEWEKIPLAPRGGKGGGQETPPKILRARHKLFERLRDAKPSARFRRKT